MCVYICVCARVCALYICYIYICVHAYILQLNESKGIVLQLLTELSFLHQVCLIFLCKL